MKILRLWLCMAAITAVARADGDFIKTMTSEEIANTGLGKLTTDELARLKAVVERYKAGGIAAAEKARPSPGSGPGWLKALVTLQRTADKPDKEDTLETRLAGEFSGWNGHTVFKLENGQVWRQDSKDDYNTDTLQSPKVKIYPGMFGVYWLEIEGVNPCVKVKPIRLE